MRMQDRSDCRIAKHRAQLQFLMHQVEELNGRLQDLGVTEGILDLEERRARMIPPAAAGEKEEVPEQTFHARFGSRNTFRTG
jgi:hypothetical protein